MGPLSGGCPKGYRSFVAQDISNLSTCSIRGKQNNGGIPFWYLGLLLKKSIGVKLERQKVEFFILLILKKPDLHHSLVLHLTLTTGQLSINGDDVVQVIVRWQCGPFGGDLKYKYVLHRLLTAPVKYGNTLGRLAYRKLIYVS